MTLEEAKKRIKELDSGYRFGGSNYESGWEDALCRVTEILDEIDTESVENPDKMTLTELARELRKIFEFDILTYSAWEDGDCYVTEQLDEIILWYRRVSDALPEYDETAGNFYEDASIIALLKISSMNAMVSESLDLSEYKDADGNIDYSKCIVEVE